VAELVLNRAEKLVRELVREGEVQREAASGLVRDLMERTKDDRDEVTRALRAEIQNQTAQLGIASAREVERLEEALDGLTDRVARLEAQFDVASRTPAGNQGEKTTRKKASGKKASRKTTTRKKTTRKASSPRTGTAVRTTSGRKPGSGHTQGS
jgi:polyhydroxyalkanoate synthesis regulator phasin